MRLHMHMSEKRQHKGSPQCARMRRKEQTNCNHRGGATRPRCQPQSTVLLNPFSLQLGDAAVLPAWSHNVHFTLGSSITTFSIPPWLARCPSSINAPVSDPLSGICLSNDVRRSDVCAFVPMSAQFSNVSTDTNRNSFLRYASCIPNSLIEKCRTFPDPVLVQIPRAALLSDAMVTSACTPICSKTCEVCFGVATVFRDATVKHVTAIPLNSARPRLPGSFIRCPTVSVFTAVPSGLLGS